MTEIDITRIDHDKLSGEVRIRLAARLERLLNAMEVFLEDDPRDFSASQLAVYIQTIRLLGDLYQVRDRPRSDDEFVPVGKVQALVDAAVVEAVAVARLEEQERVRLARGLELEGAAHLLRERLDRLREG